ncbi:hypothetical protein Scep_009934 [Stephania cephalantha]|uniref:Uncharacterized protein n=1 Tax=Stephania cephalantha TaxID=152367 RepID=A0AAP0JVG9_9MAGN
MDRYIRMTKYAGSVADTDADQAYYFVHGLLDFIGSVVATIAPSTLQEANERAMAGESFVSTRIRVPVASLASSHSMRGSEDDQRKTRVRRSWKIDQPLSVLRFHRMRRIWRQCLMVQRRVTLVHYSSQHCHILNISTIRGLMAEAVARDRVRDPVECTDRDNNLVMHRDKDMDMFHLDRYFNVPVWACGQPGTTEP